MTAMMYATDEHAKPTAHCHPMIDGSPGFCDQPFRLIQDYTKALM